MRIAIVSRSPSVPTKGGVQRASDTLARGLVSRGFDVFYYNLSRSDLEYSYPVPKFTAPNENYRSTESLEDYQKFIKRCNIDVIINQDGLFETSDFFLNTDNIHRVIRKISVIHSAPFFSFDRLWEECLLLKNNSLEEYLRRCARILLYPITRIRVWEGWRKHYKILATRESELCLLSSRYAADLTPLHEVFKRVHAIANPNTYTEPLNIEWKEKCKEVLFVGRLDNRSKQIQLLLKVWARVSQECPDWTLLIVGAGPDEQFLKKTAEHMRLINIRFLGRRDPSPYYMRASILCMTSLYEGFPMVLTEAQQHGIACIAYDSFKSVRDIITDKETGILVRPFSVSEYSKALINLIRNVNMRASIAYAARESVQRFSEEKIIGEWTKYLTEK